MLILLSASSLLAVARQALTRSGHATDRTQAALTAASGMAYASIRLQQDPYPKYLDTPTTRPDTWHAREPFNTPLDRMLNVSYARGEPWKDTIILASDGHDNDGDGLKDEPGEGNGLFTPGERYQDLDGDGRYTSWSGRLRAGARTSGNRFSLSIGSQDGKIPVNGGYLDDLDRQPYPFIFGGSWGVPDHRDPAASPYHKGLVHVLNNLGAVTRPGGAGTRRRDYRSGIPLGSGHTFEFSWLGEDLIAGRPPGGYRSLAQIRQTLAGLGYAPAECDLFLPFLDVGPYTGPIESGRVSYRSSAPWPFPGAEGGNPDDFPFSPPIVLSTAPREVLASLWRYLASSQDLPPVASSPAVPLQRVYGEPAGDMATASRSGGTPIRFRADDYYAYHFMIFPDESELLADTAASLRTGGSVSWQELYSAILQKIPTLFSVDYNNLGGASSLCPVYQRAWLHAKADLAFRALALDAPPMAGHFHGIATWAGWGLDRDPSTSPVEQGSGVGLDWIYQGPIPASETSPLPSRPYDDEYWSLTSRRIKPQGITTAPPLRFQIECAGSAGRSRYRANGSFRAADPLYFASQEDFEILRQNVFLDRIGGISTVLDDPPPPDRRVRMSDGGRIYPHLISLPRTNRRSTFAPGSAPFFPAEGYSRLYGALTLAPREIGRRGAQLYWTFPEDFDGVQDAPGTDDWHEADPAYSHPPSDPMEIYENATDFWPEFHQYRNPSHTDGMLSTLHPFQCPGMNAPSGTPLLAFSADFWINLSYPYHDNRAVFLVYNAQRISEGHWNQHFIKLYVSRGDPSQPGKRPYDATFRLSVDAKDLMGIPRATASPAWLIRSPGPASPHTPGIFHVAVTVAKDPLLDEMTYRLYVNGSKFAADGSEMKHPHLHLIAVKDGESMTLSYGDELRLFETALPSGEPGSIYSAGRFVPSGAYKSPLYVFHEPASFGKSQWLGLIPPGFVDVSGQPVDPFRILVEAYGTAPGDLAHPNLIWQRTLGPSGTVDDLPPNPVKSFRYTIEIDCNDVVGVLDDSPVFESIWFTLRRRGRAPVWSEWE